MKRYIWVALLALLLPACQSSLVKKLVQAPEVKSITLQSFSIQDKRMVFDVGLFNPNAFALPIDALDGAVQLNGLSIGRFSAKSKQRLAAKQTQTITLPITLDAEALGRAAREVLKQGKASYVLDGGAKTSVGKVPFRKEGELSAQDVLSALLPSFGF